MSVDDASETDPEKGILRDPFVPLSSSSPWGPPAAPHPAASPTLSSASPGSTGPSPSPFGASSGAADAPPAGAPASPFASVGPVGPFGEGARGSFQIPPPPPRAPKRSLLTRVSGWALGGLAGSLVLGPIGAVLAVVLGVLGRREAQRDGNVSARRWSTFAVVVGALLAPAWGVGLSYLVWTRVIKADEPGFEPVEPVAIPAQPPVQPPFQRRGRPQVPGVPNRVPSGPGIPTAPNGPGELVPTRVAQRGRITVVDVGQDQPSLAESLGHQRAEAARAKQTLLLMTTANGCEPCSGVSNSLADPLVQRALADVRIVRVDVRAFHDDLDDLKISDDRIPGFYLLSHDLSPRDGVDGGEWDDDIPANIAPVLGAFVRGKYQKRREAWKPLPGSGVTL